MNYPKAIRGVLGIAAIVLGSASAHAQLFRAYLASTGSDTNPCTVGAPCRLLPAALGAVADGGEIWMLDSANYNTGTVNVTKSVTILAVPGALGSVVAANGGAALAIATPGVKVALRNIAMTKLVTSPGTHAVHMTAGAELTVDRCNFYNLVNDGIYVAGAAKVRVSSSLFSGNDVGIRATENSSVNISNSRFFDNGFAGILVDGNTVGTAVANVSDVVVTGSQFGIIAWSRIAGSNTQAFVRRATVSAALEGVVSYMDVGAGSPLVTLGGSMVVANDIALVVSGATAVLKVFGDTLVAGSTTADLQGTLTTVAKQ